MKTGDTDCWQRRQSIEPRPRYYAHQLVYEEEVGLHFMFGGNPGGKENMNGKLRLGDFLRLELQRQQNKDLMFHHVNCLMSLNTFQLNNSP